MKNNIVFAAIAALAIAGGAVALAQTDTGGMPHSEGMAHTDGMAQTDTMNHTAGMSHDVAAGSMGGLPTEPGQGAFAAVSEIVAMLAADPNTDWSVVNVRALRDHLVDMDMLISNANVTASQIEGGLEMRISLNGLGGGAVSRMVPAHGPVLAAETGWNSVVENTGDAIVWRVSSAIDADQIKALGFFGLMTVDDHHTEHHFGMASGLMVH